MAITLSLLTPTQHSHFSNKSQLNHHHHSKKLQSFPFSLHKSNRSIPNSPSFSTSHTPDSPSPSTGYNPPRTNLFLTNQEFQNLQFLDKFTYTCKLQTGYLSIRPMRDSELDMTVELLAESFAESMFLPSMYLTVLGFLIKQYMIERRGLIPHAVTLIGFLRETDEQEQEQEELLAGTVEVSFDQRGANASPPTPTPPKDCPYICNMTVKESLRRRGIGWHLLKASEELISNMSSSRNVYLHCRMIDSAPFSMYKKAGYNIVKTDSFLILFTLQRRKHLMCKELPALSKSTDTIIVIDEQEAFSSEDRREPEPFSSDEYSLDMDE